MSKTKFDAEEVRDVLSSIFSEVEEAELSRVVNGSYDGTSVRLFAEGADDHEWVDVTPYVEQSEDRPEKGERDVMEADVLHIRTNGDSRGGLCTTDTPTAVLYAKVKTYLEKQSFHVVDNTDQIYFH